MDIKSNFYKKKFVPITKKLMATIKCAEIFKFYDTYLLFPSGFFCLYICILIFFEFLYHIINKYYNYIIYPRIISIYLIIFFVFKFIMEKLQKVVKSLPYMSKDIVDDTIHEKVLSYLSEYASQGPETVAK